MRRFRIKGASRETGEDVELIVEATTAAQAETKANALGVLVESVGEQPLVPVDAPRRSSSLGITSLVIGAVALLCSFIPIIGVLSVPLGAAAILFAILGLIISISRRGAGVGYSLGGGVLGGIALCWALLQTSMITNVLSVISNGSHTVEDTVEPAGIAAPIETNTSQPAEAALPSEVAYWNDFEVSITDALLGRVPYRSLDSVISDN